MVSRTLLLAAALLLSTITRAQTTDSQSYRLVDPPQHTVSSGRIEVIEFFSYGCPRCSQVNPQIESWIAKLPRDVALRRIATGFGQKAWTNLAKTYYALAATGDLEKLDSALFHAIHKEHLPLFDQNSISEWVGKHGVDRQKFDAAFTSFGVNTQLNQAEQMVQAYKIDTLPAIAIDGKYVVTGHTFDELLAHANAIIVKLHADSKTSGIITRP
jgi:thiol:disulfide interchange protein DsbA